MNSISLITLSSNWDLLSSWASSLVLWQVICAVLVVLLVTVIVRGRSQKRKIRGYMERRTEKIIFQKEKIETQSEELRLEHEKSNELLNNVFPDKIVKVLKNKGVIKPEYYEEASVLFADFVGFSKITPFLTANQLVDNLNTYFKEFDSVITENKLILIKTIGDSYFAVGGVPKREKKNPIYTVISGLQMQQAVLEINARTNLTWKIRVGITTGEIAAGVLDTKRPMFDVWGSSVNIASRLQEAGAPGKVNISEETYRLIYPFFDCEERGEIDTKNVGEIAMYYVNRIKPRLSQNEEGTIPNELFWKYVKNIKTSKADYISLFKKVKTKLRNELPEGIYYHNEKHALNIMNSVEKICFGEGIYDENILILKTAALLHDIGFLTQYHDNELVGAEKAREMLPKFGFEKEQIDQICELIIATIPTREPLNIYEKIIKDADLDYLGRGDFEQISKKLKKEYLYHGIVKTDTEYYEIQVKFLESHSFFTKTAHECRDTKKLKNLAIAKQLYEANTQ